MNEIIIFAFGCAFGYIVKGMLEKEIEEIKEGEKYFD